MPTKPGWPATTPLGWKKIEAAAVAYFEPGFVCRNRAPSLCRENHGFKTIAP